jgi:putative DNA primase/helicase
MVYPFPQGTLPEIVNWIWKGWLARGKFHLIAGAPEAGKTTIALSLAAILSAADYWPDGTKASAGNVLVWCNEDDLADTILPRLIQMGADLKHIKFVFQQRDTIDGKPRPFDPSRDMEPLTQAAANIEGGVTMLILDPVVAAVGGKVDSHNNSQTRSALQPVKDFAEKADCAVVGISHFTKGTSGKDPIERVTGSLAFGALPRLVIAVCINGEEDGPERLFVRAKTNIGPRGGGFGFSIVALPLLEQPNITATRVKWGEALEGSAKELLDDAAPKESGGTKQEMAEGFLRTAIKIGEKRAPEDVTKEAKECGISGQAS